MPRHSPGHATSPGKCKGIRGANQGKLTLRLPACQYRPFEDAFAAAQKEASPEPTAAGRRRKLTAKGRTRATDPQVTRQGNPCLHGLASVVKWCAAPRGQDFCVRAGCVPCLQGWVVATGCKFKATACGA